MQEVEPERTHKTLELALAHLDAVCDSLEDMTYLLCILR